MQRIVAIPVRRPTDTLRRLVLSGLVAGALAPLAVANATAALHDLGLERPGFVTAPPTIEVADGGTPMFSLPSLRPGGRATAVRAIRVRSETPVRVLLHADVAGTGLDRFLILTVARDGEVLFHGALADFPSSGLVDPLPWRGTDLRGFRFSVRLAGDPAAAGLSARVRFVWEARQV